MKDFGIPESKQQSVDPIEDFEKAHEYTDLTSKIHQFDQSREAMYSQAAYIMHGQGGDTQEEALEILEVLGVATAKSFSVVGMEILDQTPDIDEAKVMIANLYVTDETERIIVLRELNPDGDYIPTPLNVAQSALEMLFEEADEEDYPRELRNMYAASLQTDMNDCLPAAIDNIIEAAAEQVNARREAIKHAVYDIAKMAGAALIAVALTRRHNK